MTDGGLVELIWNREDGALAALQRAYGPWCRAILERILTDPRDVEECVSDCWLAVWRAIPPARPEHFKGWLGAVVRNQALAMARRSGRQVPLVDEAALELADALPAPGGPEEELQAAELGRAISEFLRGEKREVRAAFLRRYWYAEGVEQVAARMGWSVPKTKSVLSRVKNRLRVYLEKEGYL